MSNTAIQMKSHTGKSAGNKTKHNERKDNHIKNPNFQILHKDNLHKFHYKEPIQKPKTTQRMLEVEKGLKGQIATLNAKINTYSKRVQEYEAREKPNLKQIEKIKSKIDDLKLQKEKIPQQQDKRGRPITKRYVEFEFSLTNSNHLKHDKQVQKAFIKSVNELKQQNPIFQYLKPTSDIMHLDQESLHVHNINKIMSKKSLTAILKELDPQNSNRNFLSNMQNQFNEIVRNNMKELGLEIERQQKGIKYLPLKKYKEQQLEKQAQQAQPKQEIKKEKNIDKIIERQEQRQQDQIQQQQPQQKQQNLQQQPQQQKEQNQDKLFRNFKKIEERQKYLKEQKQQQQAQPIEKQKEEDFDFSTFDTLVKRVENTNKTVTQSKILSNLSAFEAHKKRLKEQYEETLKENQKENQIEKQQEKSNSKKHFRSR